MTSNTTKSQFARLAGSQARLVSRAQSDLAREEWGAGVARPWVHMADSHEALEKALWCYERGMVPIVTELDPSLALAVAERWKAESLMCDVESLRSVAARLPQSVRTISVFGAIFPDDLESLVPDREVRRIARP
jgi:hypothetical protein